MRRVISNRIAIAFLAFLTLAGFNPAKAEADRIKLDVTINGQIAHLALDTGASDTVLFTPAAERLGLATHPSNKAPAALKAQITDPVEVTVFGVKDTSPLLVVTPPKDLKSDVEGVVGWGTLARNVWVFDASKQRVSVGVEFPAEARSWTKYRVHPGERTLWLEVPLDSGKTGLLFVDTGDAGGAMLNPAMWKQWQSDHPKAPASIYAIGTVYQRVIVSHECWADDLSLGSIALQGIPVSEAAAHDAQKPDYLATLGLFALRRMDLVVDGEGGWAYVRPAKTPPVPYSHNRAAAVFIPDDSNSDELVAHVVEGGPAFRAGVRDGDVLLKIGELDVTRWKTDPMVLPLSRFWEAPAGTHLHLTLRREQKELTADVTLEQLLGPQQEQKELGNIQMPATLPGLVNPATRPFVKDLHL